MSGTAWTTCDACGLLNVPIVDMGAPPRCDACEEAHVERQRALYREAREYHKTARMLERMARRPENPVPMFTTAAAARYRHMANGLIAHARRLREE